MNKPADDNAGGQRLDRWLWCARFFKTRSSAARFIDDGGVRLKRGAVSIEPLKPATPVKVGDGLALLVADRLRVISVAALASRRGPPAEARALYDESAPKVGAA